MLNQMNINTMKTIIVTIAFIVSSITCFSQSEYCGPHNRALYILDSLTSVPYIPMDARYKKRYSESFKEKFINYFGKDLQFIPEYSIYDMSYESFISDKTYASEDDSLYNSLMSSFGLYVVGKSVVPVEKSDKYKSIWILELYCKCNNNYCTPIFYELKNGELEYIPVECCVPAEFIVNEPNRYK